MLIEHLRLQLGNLKKMQHHEVMNSPDFEMHRAISTLHYRMYEGYMCWIEKTGEVSAATSSSSHLPGAIKAMFGELLVYRLLASLSVINIWVPEHFAKTVHEVLSQRNRMKCDNPPYVISFGAHAAENIELLDSSVSMEDNYFASELSVQTFLHAQESHAQLAEISLADLNASAVINRKLPIPIFCESRRESVFFDIFVIFAPVFFCKWLIFALTVWAYKVYRAQNNLDPSLVNYWSTICRVDADAFLVAEVVQLLYRIFFKYSTATLGVCERWNLFISGCYGLVLAIAGACWARIIHARLIDGSNDPGKGFYDAGEDWLLGDDSLWVSLSLCFYFFVLRGIGYFLYFPVLDGFVHKYTRKYIIDLGRLPSISNDPAIPERPTRVELLDHESENDDQIENDYQLTNVEKGTQKQMQPTHSSRLPAHPNSGKRSGSSARPDQAEHAAGSGLGSGCCWFGACRTYPWCARLRETCCAPCLLQRAKNTKTSWVLWAFAGLFTLTVEYFVVAPIGDDVGVATFCVSPMSAPCESHPSFTWAWQAGVDFDPACNACLVAVLFISLFAFVFVAIDVFVIFDLSVAVFGFLAGRFRGIQGIHAASARDLQLSILEFTRGTSHLAFARLFGSWRRTHDVWVALVDSLKAADRLSATDAANLVRLFPPDPASLNFDSSSSITADANAEALIETLVGLPAYARESLVFFLKSCPVLANEKDQIEAAVVTHLS
jgi:hypothetical protein